MLLRAALLFLSLSLTPAIAQDVKCPRAAQPGSYEEAAAIEDIAREALRTRSMSYLEARAKAASPFGAEPIPAEVASLFFDFLMCQGLNEGADELPEPDKVLIRTKLEAGQIAEAYGSLQAFFAASPDFSAGLEQPSASGSAPEAQSAADGEQAPGSAVAPVEESAPKPQPYATRRVSPSGSSVAPAAPPADFAISSKDESPTRGLAPKTGAAPPPVASPPPSASPPIAAAPTAAPDPSVTEECRALGVTENCVDYTGMLAKLKEKPLEYNHPKLMYQGRKTEISLVLRTDWKGDGAPLEPSAEMQGLPGEVKQGASKVTQFMSARLAGPDFDIDPSGLQERLVTTTAPTTWNWIVTPTETGQSKRLKLELYAHIQAGGQVRPPILIKTLDASIDVDVRTWDWIVSRAQTIEPIYGILATFIGLLTAFFTLIYRRSGPKQAPVMADAVQTPPTPKPETTVASVSSLSHKPWFPKPPGKADDA